MRSLIRIACSALALAAVGAMMPAVAQAQTQPPTTEDHKAHHPDGQPGPKPTQMPGGMTGTMSTMCEMMGMTGAQGSMATAPEERLAALKTKLEITEAQEPQWKRFAEALRASDRAMHEMHRTMMQPPKSATLPEQLAHRRTMAEAHVTALKAIEQAVGPLYATFSPSQKKTADSLKVTPMGVM